MSCPCFRCLHSLSCYCDYLLRLNVLHQYLIVFPVYIYSPVPLHSPPIVVYLVSVYSSQCVFSCLLQIFTQFLSSLFCLALWSSDYFFDRNFIYHFCTVAPGLLNPFESWFVVLLPVFSTDPVSTNWPALYSLVHPQCPGTSFEPARGPTCVLTKYFTK